MLSSLDPITKTGIFAGLAIFLSITLLVTIIYYRKKVQAAKKRKIANGVTPGTIADTTASTPLSSNSQITTAINIPPKTNTIQTATRIV
uniref:Uncharacterized protein n=1 Tax=Rhabditophanes sp. KR3021 TaxID=114890 RepID=A0AC35UEW1_9BILA